MNSSDISNANSAPPWIGLLPGVVAALLVLLVSMPIASLLGSLLSHFQANATSGRPSPVSAITVAIVLGALLANLFPLPSSTLEPGLKFSMKNLLRLGIILVGLRLSFLDVLKLGVWGVPAVLIVIASALLFSALFCRILNVSPRLGALTAAATAICGVTAAVATAPVIEADEKELAYTVANVTLFGLLGMLFYPYLAHALFADAPASAGLFLGTSIHDTSQVMGAAMSYRDLFNDEAAFRVATVTKLTRNVFIAAVVPLLGFLYARRRAANTRVQIASLFPLFVLGFILAAVIRSLGDGMLDRGLNALALLDATQWRALTKFLGETSSQWLLGTAMAAVGLSTDFSMFRQMGLRPLYLGFAVALVVGVVGLGVAALIGPLIKI